MNVVNRVITEWGKQMVKHAADVSAEMNQNSEFIYHLSSNQDETWNLFYSIFKPDIHYLHQLLKFEHRLEMPFFELLELMRRYIMDRQRWFSFRDISQNHCLILLYTNE